MVPNFVNWVGYNGATIPIQHAARQDKHSGYKLKNY